MKRRLQLQRKRYNAHKAEFKNKVTHQMRNAWRSTLAEWGVLRETIKIAESSLRRKVVQAGEGEATKLALATAKGYQMGIEAAKAEHQQRTQ
jgi:hypothetical protein